MATSQSTSQPTVTPLQIFELQKRKLIRLGNDIKSINEQGRAVASDPSKLPFFKGMFRTLQPTFDKFMDVWDELLHSHLINNLPVEFPSQADLATLNNVKRYYYEANEHYVQHASPPSLPSVPIETSQSYTQIVAPRGHLPRINLPEFHGQLSEWPYFRDTFISLVHNDQHLSKIEKYHFLIGALKNQSRSVIKNIPLEEESYEQAWQAVMKAYDNKRELASSYLNKIINYKSIQGKPTVNSLKHLCSTISENVAAFKRLKIPNAIEFILFELTLRCLDTNTREAFEVENTHIDYPEFQNLISFIEKRCMAMSRSGVEKPLSVKPPVVSPTPNKFQSRFQASGANRSVLFTQSSDAKQSSTTKSSTTSDLQRSRIACVVCKNSHKLSDCPKFRSAAPDQRSKTAKEFNVCRNCLYPYHLTSNCPSKWNCRICHARHHTMLHESSDNSDAAKSNLTCQLNDNNKSLSFKQADPAPSSVFSTTSTINNGALLGTARGAIRTSEGRNCVIRMIIDCGSQHSFITKACAESLGLKPNSCNQRISGLGESVITHTHGEVMCYLEPISDTQTQLVTKPIVVTVITPTLPQQSLPANLWSNYTHLDLADPNFWEPGHIDFLLGADLYPSIILGIPIYFGPNKPYALKTIFGHIILGPYEQTPYANAPDVSTSLLITNGKQMSEVMDKFWQLEEVQDSIYPAPEDIKCEEHFQRTHRRLPSGRYCVRLPFKSNPPNLGPSKQRALTRLFNLETKLSKNPILSQKYREFITEYVELDHMSKTERPAEYVIPHHAVFKENAEPAEKWKLRVVFDASARTSKGSLNEYLMIGPKLQKDISEILLNFRTFAFVFTADIVKMYRQIIIDENDRDYQHILWRFAPEQPVDEYELKTLTYGLSSAPYLALRVIQQLVQDEGDKFPLASAALRQDIYVDDIVTGAQTLNEALSLQQEIIHLLQKGDFQLSKWASNHSELLPQIANESDLNHILLTDKEDSTIKILGMHWDPKSDSFAYHVKIPHLQLTKRSILSAIARIYDPLGYLAPVVFYAKHLLQKTWQSGVGWDECVPEYIGQEWVNFINYLPALADILIPRNIPNNDETLYTIIGFSDASERGYCAVIYLQSISNQESSCRIIKAKTKLAPLKTRTIPCLELCAALLLVNLYHSIKPFIKKYRIGQTHFFSDSTIVLGWLQTSPHLLKTFVANRVSQIIRNSELLWWHHIPGEENPADLGSRGMSPSLLVNQPLWWTGPSWTTKPLSEWPEFRFHASPKLPETKHSIVTLTSTQISSDDFLDFMERFSDYSKLIRIVAYILRFKHNTLNPEQKRFGAIKLCEFQEANKRCLTTLQSHFYPNTSENNQLSILRSLNVFRDKDNILRVGGRLRHSYLSDSSKHPILLPRRCHFNSILIDYYHRMNLHVGPSALHAILAQRYWIPAGRSLIRQRTLKCLNCLKFYKRPQAPYMGDLPASRFAGCRPFQHTGVDYAGPFLCKNSSLRKAPITKVYLCLFVCLSTKALHLETVYSLSTESFLDAFDRFVSRRGLPSRMFSDCGTNFVGASNYFKEIAKWHNASETQESILNRTVPLGIQWDFNPPASPHFGGLWEAGVKSAKSLLLKTLGNQPYTKDELTTIFVKIEGIFNTRPITPLSSDPNDLEPLTPGHFLIGGPLKFLPEVSFLDVSENRLSHWQCVRKRIESVWKRWKQEYLNTLQQRTKWTRSYENIQVGDMVLFPGDNVRAHNKFTWPLARVLEIHPGKDNVVRVVTLKTSNGVLKRPITKLIPLKPVLVED